MQGGKRPLKSVGGTSLSAVSMVTNRQPSTFRRELGQDFLRLPLLRRLTEVTFDLQEVNQGTRSGEQDFFLHQNHGDVVSANNDGQHTHTPPSSHNKHGQHGYPFKTKMADVEPAQRGAPRKPWHAGGPRKATHRGFQTRARRPWVINKISPTTSSQTTPQVPGGRILPHRKYTLSHQGGE